MNDPRFQIRSMSRSELELAVEWAAAEGWNPGLYEASAFYTADPEGFLIGLLDGRPVACASAIRFGDDFGFLGFHIVRPAQRGKGYGLQIWQAAMQRLAGRRIGLNGVQSLQDKYHQSGFVPAWRNLRYRGLAGCDAYGDAPTVDLASLPFEQIATFDRQFFPADRTAFLRAWLSQPGAHGLGTLDAEGRLDGYALARHCRNGYKIGPLFACTPLQAEQLLRNLRARLPDGAPVVLDIPDNNPDALALVQRHGMQLQSVAERLYMGGIPPLPTGQIYAITSFELG